MSQPTIEVSILGAGEDRWDSGQHYIVAGIALLDPRWGDVNGPSTDWTLLEEGDSLDDLTLGKIQAFEDKWEAIAAENGCAFVVAEELKEFTDELLEQVKERQ